jgi:hypothetical protein
MKSHQTRKEAAAPPPEIENIVVDEANERTYVVLAPKVLNDGELYRAIRIELLKRGSLSKGTRLVINTASPAVIKTRTPDLEEAIHPSPPLDPASSITPEDLALP